MTTKKIITGLDNFIIEDDSPYREEHLLINEFIHSRFKSNRVGNEYERADFAEFIERNQDRAKKILFAFGERRTKGTEVIGNYFYTFGAWVKFLFERVKPIFSQEDIIKFLENGVNDKYLDYKDTIYPYISKYFKIEDLKPELKKLLEHHLEEKSKHRDVIWRNLSDILGVNNPTELLKKEFINDFAEGNFEKKLYGNYPLYDQDKYYEAHLFIEKHFEEEKYNYPFTKNTIFEAIKAKDRVFIKNVVMACFYRLAFEACYKKFWRNNFKELIKELCKKKLPFTEDELLLTYQGFAQGIFEVSSYYYAYFSVIQHFKNVEEIIKQKGITEKVKQIFEYIVKTAENSDDKGLTKVVLKIKDIMADENSEMIIKVLLSEQDDFGKQVNEYLDQHKNHLSWYKILQLATTVSGGKPSKKFEKKALELLEEQKDFTSTMENWLTILVEIKTTISDRYYYNYYLDRKNQDIAKGLVWMTSFLDKPRTLYPILYKLVIRSFEKIPGIGPSAGALGNACIYALSSFDDLEAVSYLTRLRLKIRQKNTRSLIEKYIQSSAQSLGVSPNLLEDMSVQEYDLVNGKAIHKFEDYEFHIEVERIGKVSQKWIKPDGKTQKSVPAFVKNDFAQELKAIKSDIKEMQQTLTAQRDRLDRSYIHEATWKYKDFKKYYEEHGLMSFMAKHLVWVAQKGKEKANVFWQENAWKTIDNQELNWLDDETNISLWHPVMANLDEVLAWREFMQDFQIRQPIKQAYREVYILTDAELNTRFYSNRMAAHLLKQHQFNALAGLRNWKYSLLGAYDDGRDDEIARLDLPKHQMRAEFWINELNNYDDGMWTDSGIWQYVATDQVRFTPYGNETLNLVDVPKLVFSEVMRDVDLFVGVASVGNDPEWADNSGNPQHRAYWQSYSFGNLSEVAKTRKTILEKLLPKLKIAKVSEIEGNFLKVKGTFTTYKIHIGSTNILMEPNDQYLCIVPSRKKDTSSDKLFLPFDGDRGFSILISKAMMLADDTKITDQTILSQIRR